MAVPTYTDREAALELQRNPGVVQSSPDPTEATAETVLYMCELIRDSLADGIVQRATLDADRFHPVTHRPWECVWWFAKHTVKFVHHQKLLVAWLGAPDELQLLIRPDALLKMREPKGDCAVYTTLICAMLDCCGLDWEICTVAVDPRQPGVYSHVYPRVILPNGRRVPMDASHGKYPGWEVPAEHMTAKQVWDREGNPVEDSAAQQFDGLHGYLYGGADRRGLGQDDDGGDDGGDGSTAGTDTSGSTSTTTPITASFPGVCPSGQIWDATLAECYGSVPALPIPPVTVSGSGSSAASIASDIAAITAGGNAIARTALGLPPLGTTPISTTTLMWIGGLAMGAIVLFSIMEKK